MRQTALVLPRLRVMHVASGGFSGATQVALDLTRAAGRHECLLVLRQKRHTPRDRVEALRQSGVPVELVPGWSHGATIWALSRLARRWGADVIVGHGFPEHLLARWSGLWAARAFLGSEAGRAAGHAAGPAAAQGQTGTAPLLVQVEHNARERYTAFKRWQVRALAAHTAAFVGVSRTVADGLLAMGLPAHRVLAVRNGIDLTPFSQSEAHPWPQRESAILMAARFGAQKDHETLIRSLPLLAQRHGLRPPLRLAGGGSDAHRQRMHALVSALGLQGQVEFLGHRPDLPALLQRHRVAALSTHYEGLPLSLAEAMAAGCAVVGSDVGALRETLGGGQWGWLAAPQDPQSWADALALALQGGEAVLTRVDAARHYARQELSRARMVADHEALLERLVALKTSGLPMADWRLTA